jgi:hypothetical protein
MGRIDNQVGIARAVRGQPLAKSPRQRREVLGCVYKPTNKVEKFEKRAKPAAKIQQLLARPGQGDAILPCESDDIVDFEAAFQVNVDFRLWQGDEPATHTPSYSPGQSKRPKFGGAVNHNDCVSNRAVLPALRDRARVCHGSDQSMVPASESSV